MHINSHTSSDRQSHDLNRICRSKRIINLFQIYRCCCLNAQRAIQGSQHLLTSQAELGVLPCGNNSSIFWLQMLIQHSGQKGQGGWFISSVVSIRACFILLLVLRLPVSCLNPTVWITLVLCMVLFCKLVGISLLLYYLLPTFAEQNISPGSDGVW